MLPKSTKVERNRELVLKRVKDPKKWSFGALGKFYGIDKTFAEQIYKRDLSKYAPHVKIPLKVPKKPLKTGVK